MTSRILHAIPSRAALVVGDICLDRWCTYDPAAAEPSRETGIARIGVVSTELTPGAGGTVANNLAALGVGRVSVLGVIGDDGHGTELVRALQLRNIETELLVRTPSIATFTYTKLINSATGAEDQPRIDFINAKPLGHRRQRKIVGQAARQRRRVRRNLRCGSGRGGTGCGGRQYPRVSFNPGRRRSR